MHNVIHPALGSASALLIQALDRQAPEPKGFFNAHSGLWAALSASAGLLYLIVSVVGLLFIWRQLRANTAAVEVASTSANAAARAANIAFASSRPWMKLTISRAILTFNPDDPEEVGCQIFYRIENLGHTPAVEASLRYLPVAASARDRNIEGDFQALMDGRSFHKTVYFPGDIIEQTTAANFPFPRRADESMLGFRIVAAVVYKAQSDGEQYWTPLAMSLQHRDPPADRVYRFERKMGKVDCLTLLMNDETPSPT